MSGIEYNKKKYKLLGNYIKGHYIAVNLDSSRHIRMSVHIFSHADIKLVKNNKSERLFGKELNHKISLINE